MIKSELDFLASHNPQLLATIWYYPIISEWVPLTWEAAIGKMAQKPATSPEGEL